MNAIVESLETTSEPITFTNRMIAIQDAAPKLKIENNADFWAIRPLSVGDIEVQSQFPDLAVIDQALGDAVVETVSGEGAWLVSQVGVWVEDRPITYMPTVWAISRYFINQALNDTPILTLCDDDHDSHAAITFANGESDTLALINELQVSLLSDPSTFVKYTDQDAIDLFGKNPNEISLNLWDEAEITKFMDWAKKAMTPPKIKNISLDAIAHKNRKLHDVWKLAPSSTVKVEINNQPGFKVDEIYLVTRIVHRITPESWETDLELWRNN
jgi:hypothetical protein